MSNGTSKTCPKCGDALIDGKLFCPNCGLAIVSLPERVAIDSYVEARVQQAMSARLADQNNLTREIADRAEDVVWSRIKRYTWAAGLALFLLGLYGFSSIQEAKTTIANEARSRLEPVIEDTEKRVKAAQTDIGDTDKKIKAVQKQLDDTSKLADDQSKRITAQGGEIDKKLEDLQKAANQANSLSSGYEKQATNFEKELGEMRKHAEEQSRRLEDTQKAFEAKISQVTQQINNESIQEAYPTLGQKLYVTFNGHPWKGANEKKPGEKWVNINLDPLAVGENRVSKEQLKSLSDALEKAGYTPYFGFFGVGGPVSTGFGSMGPEVSGVVYLNASRQKDASELVKIAGETLHIPGMDVHYVDPKSIPEPMKRLVLETSGIDFQIFIARYPR